MCFTPVIYLKQTQTSTHLVHSKYAAVRSGEPQVSQADSIKIITFMKAKQALLMSSHSHYTFLVKKSHKVTNLR